MFVYPPPAYVASYSPYYYNGYAHYYYRNNWYYHDGGGWHGYGYGHTPGALSGYGGWGGHRYGGWGGSGHGRGGGGHGEGAAMAADTAGDSLARLLTPTDRHSHRQDGRLWFAQSQGRDRAARRTTRVPWHDFGYLT